MALRARIKQLEKELAYSELKGRAYQIIVDRYISIDLKAYSTVKDLKMALRNNSVMIEAMLKEK